MDDKPGRTEQGSTPVTTPAPNPGAHNVYVRGVPQPIWRRARQNALLSGIPFKDFVIRLLAESEPFTPPLPPPQPTDTQSPSSPSREPAGTSILSGR